MGYRKIVNLYLEDDIMLFRECYASEKVHGSSAHISYKDGQLHFFSGGAKHDQFVAIFDHENLARVMPEVNDDVTVYGEVYGGSMQGMSHTYGKELRFIAFEVKIGDYWLDVPAAESVVLRLGLEFVPYRKIRTTINSINRERDRESEVAVRRGMGHGHKREGVVLRPLIEVRKNNGDRIMAKHKADDFCETKSKRETQLDPDKRERLTEANAIADEWVTKSRLEHVLDSFPDAGIEKTGDVIKSMIADVKAECGDELEWTKEASKAISKRAAQLFHERLKGRLE